MEVKHSTQFEISQHAPSLHLMQTTLGHYSLPEHLPCSTISLHGLLCASFLSRGEPAAPAAACCSSAAASALPPLAPGMLGTIWCMHSGGSCPSMMEQVLGGSAGMV
jgi:hypothetical protein